MYPATGRRSPCGHMSPPLAPAVFTVPHGQHRLRRQVTLSFASAGMGRRYQQVKEDWDVRFKGHGLGQRPKNPHLQCGKHGFLAGDVRASFSPR